MIDRFGFNWDELFGETEISLNQKLYLLMVGNNNCEPYHLPYQNKLYIRVKTIDPISKRAEHIFGCWVENLFDFDFSFLKNEEEFSKEDLQVIKEIAESFEKLKAFV